MPVAHNKDFLVLYGSQTGQADAISEEIFDKACKQGFQPARFSLADVEKKVNQKLIFSNKIVLKQKWRLFSGRIPVKIIHERYLVYRVDLE